MLFFASIRSPFLRKALAIDRIDQLQQNFSEHNRLNLPHVSPFLIFIAVIIGCIPGIVHLPSVQESLGINSFVLTGVALCMAIVIRNIAKLRFEATLNWGKSFSLTHTAFGLGCIPTAIIFAINPESLSVMHEVTSSSATSDASFSYLELINFVLSVALWAGLTEEFIYRGLVLSLFRRAPIACSQRTKDLMAIFASGLLFGLVHIPTWGLSLSIAVTGLGIGFGYAYVAIGERLTPLILYHAAFDILSLSASIFLATKLQIS